MEKSKKLSKERKSKVEIVHSEPSKRTPEQMQKEIAEFIAHQKVLKIGIYSDSPHIKTTTGVLANYLGQGFVMMGIPAVIIASYGVEPGGYLRFGQINVLPTCRTDTDKKGFETAMLHFMKFKLDILFYLDKDFKAGESLAKRIPTWVLARLDSVDYPQDQIEALKKYKEIIAPTLFAEKELKKYGLASTYLPIGINTKILQQYPKIESRTYFAVPKDHFCIGMLGENKDTEPSNGWDSMFESIQLFFKLCPEAKKKTTILIHSDRKDKDGIDLEQLTKGFGIDDNCVVQDPHMLILGVPEAAMARMYSSMDVLLHLSRRSGSGLSILEAGACGVPSIVTNFGAQTERVNNGKCGWLIPVVHLIPNADGSKSSIPDVQKAAEALEEAWKNKKKRTEFSNKAKAYALNYSWEVLLEQKWLPFIEKKSEEFFPKQDKKKEQHIAPAN
jgi:glycosyltransferase involved in cell wall biosynthesis